MTTSRTIDTSGYLANRGWIDGPTYRNWYAQSIEDPRAFWAEHGKLLDWMKPYSKVRDVSYGPNRVRIRWFHDGTLNASYNCLDRHLESHGERAAIIWEGDDPADHKKITYRDLHSAVCRLANGLKALGVRRRSGDDLPPDDP